MSQRIVNMHNNFLTNLHTSQLFNKNINNYWWQKIQLSIRAYMDLFSLVTLTHHMIDPVDEIILVYLV